MTNPKLNKKWLRGEIDNPMEIKIDLDTLLVSYKIGAITLLELKNMLKAHFIYDRR